MPKYVYKNKITGKKVFSEVELKDKDLILVTAFRNMNIKKTKVSRK